MKEKQIRIDGALHAKLKALAAIRGVSLRELCDAHLAKLVDKARGK